jgi:hypothetical protein
MRLKPEKINKLSEAIYNKIKTIDQAKILVSEEEFKNTVQSVILEDLQEEDDIEKEAKEILEENKIKIQMRHNINYLELLKKTKDIIARKRKFTL